MTTFFSTELTMRLLNHCLVDKRFEGRNTEKIGRFLKQVSDYGWFTENIDTITNKEINILIGYMYSNQIDEVDKYYLNHFKKNFKRLKDIIIEKNLRRKGILQEAFDSFEQKRYNSAIVLLLTQIDGICYDYYGEKFFLNDARNNYKPKVLPIIQNDLLEQHHFALNCIEQKSPINIHESKLDSFKVKLNRHEIIHGIDVDYGSEQNAFKILSMLAYLTKTIELGLSIKLQSK